MGIQVDNRERVRRLYLSGITDVRTIADVLGLSTQRVYQLVKRLRALGEIEEKAS